MKILFYDMGSYTYQDFLHYLKQEGHVCKTIYYHFPNKFEDNFFYNRFSQYLEEDNYDTVISINFFPLIALLCNKYHIKYLAWCYDSPLEEKLKNYFEYETNYIFLFDRVEVINYQAEGYSRIFHLPLAVNAERLSNLAFTPAQQAHYQTDISFVGKLYDSPLDVLLYGANIYTKGYIEGILQAQFRIYGYNFIDDLISDEILNDINSSFEKLGQSTVALNRRGLSYAISTQITHLERSFLLEQMGALYDTRFYSTDTISFKTSVKCMGPVKYHTEMPAVFRYSKINLCPTLRSIQSGIPLRALDIMGSQGVLLSNFQPELAEYFVNEQELIMYDSLEDAFAKVDFYLRHDELRQNIALNGYKKTRREFSYPQRIHQMFKIAQLI